MQKKNPRREQAHLNKATHNLVDTDTQNTAINMSPLNRHNFFAKHFLQALVNAVLFLIAKYSLKIPEAFEKTKQKHNKQTNKPTKKPE